MPTERQPNPLPPATELSKWRVERMVLVKRWRAIFRRNGTTIVVVETDDRWWHIDKLRGGKVLASRIQKRLSRHHHKLVTGKEPPPWLCSDE